MGWWTSWIVLFCLPLAVRLLPGRLAEGAPRARVDIPVALGLGVVGAVGAWFLAPGFIQGQLLSDDLYDYCAVTAWWRGAPGVDTSAVLKRPVFPGLLAGLLARRMGIVDSLVLAGTVSMGAVVASLYLWGTLVHSRVAGVTAALFCLGAEPLLFMTRDLSFYPEAAAAYTLGGVGVAVALRYRTPLALAAGGGAVGLALLTDTLGVGWAGVWLVVCLGAALWGRPRLGRVVAVLLPVGLSFLVARALPVSWMPDPDHGERPTVPVTLERRLGHHMARHLNVELGSGGPVPDGFLWGHSPLLDLPNTARRLLGYSRQTGQSPTLHASGQPGVYDLGREQLSPWVNVALISGVVGLSLAVTRRRSLLWLALTAAPTLGFFSITYNFALQSFGVLDFGQPVLPEAIVQQLRAILFIRPKFFMLGLPGVLLLLGVAWAALGGAGQGGEAAARGPRWARWGGWGPVVAGVLVVGTLAGLPPSGLSLDASWRKPYRGNNRALYLERMGHRPPNEGPDAMPAAMDLCVEALAEDQAAGRTWLLPRPLELQAEEGFASPGTSPAGPRPP